MSEPQVAGGPRSVLDAFQRVVSEETHTLRRWPELVWQQCYNELQWKGPEVQGAVADELIRRKARGARGPLIVTARREDGALLLRCPSCGLEEDIDEEELGRDVECPMGCGASLRVNPFVATRLASVD
jgi:hypothetical protein